MQVGVDQDQVQLGRAADLPGLGDGSGAHEALHPEARHDLGQDVAAFDVVIQEQDARLLQVDPRLGVESRHFTARLLRDRSGRAVEDPRAPSGSLTIPEFE